MCACVIAEHSKQCEEIASKSVCRLQKLKGGPQAANRVVKKKQSLK